MDKAECDKIIQNGIKKEQYDDKYFEAKRALENYPITQEKKYQPTYYKSTKKNKPVK